MSSVRPSALESEEHPVSRLAAMSPEAAVSGVMRAEAIERYRFTGDA